MYGFPATLKTRHDIDLLIGYLGTDWATPERKARGVDMLQSLIDRQQSYFFDRELSESEEPDGSALEYIVMTDEDAGTRRQLKLQDDPNALIHKLGLTEAEARAMINQIQGAE